MSGRTITLSGASKRIDAGNQRAALAATDVGHLRSRRAHIVQDASLSYLTEIEARGVTLAEIPRCGRFPMYSNPAAIWQRIAAFQRQAVAGER
ncbi:hypothetical protein [Burkholderia gladioli]|uniref:hypothetical protein n=1 Tax=Burkholderia gladioli TaxID=28095 RepID=UPI003A5BD058